MYRADGAANRPPGGVPMADLIAFLAWFIVTVATLVVRLAGSVL